MKKKNALIIILGGGLVREHGKWRPTTFFEKENFQQLGDNYRIISAVELYKRLVNRNLFPLILVSGGIGISKNPSHPIIADILKGELKHLGISDNVILADRKSGNTFSQLLYVQKFISKKGFNLVNIISNRYHVPRIRAMIACAPKLSNLKKKLDKKFLNLIPAESILLKTDLDRWAKEISSVYKSNFMAERMRLEKRGIREIINKTYRW